MNGLITEGAIPEVPICPIRLNGANVCRAVPLLVSMMHRFSELTTLKVCGQLAALATDQGIKISSQAQEWG
jgi:hypothetical protein